MSTYSTIDFLAVWEELHNPGFNRMEFQSVRNERGRLIITPKQWIEKTNAIGMTSKAGRYLKLTIIYIQMRCRNT